MLKLPSWIILVCVVIIPVVLYSAEEHPFFHAVKNAEYPIEVASSGKAKLVNGHFEEPAAPGSASKNIVDFTQHHKKGDINGDGTDDFAVVLRAETGGSGTFYYLSAVINHDGNPRPSEAVFLGDRLEIQSVAVEKKHVIVTLLDRKEGEAMSAKPSVEVTKKFVFTQQKLEELK